MSREKTDLTPELASLLLGKPHPKQRRINRQIVEKYARAVREGRWRLIDDALLVVGPSYVDEDNPEGHLFNGAHRCQAVVVAHRAIPVYIDWDADPSTFDLIDGGSKRIASQFITNTFATQRAAAARLILWYESRFERPPAGINISFDLHEVLQEVERREPDFDSTTALASRTWEYTGLSGSVALAVYVIARDFGYDEEVAAFVDGLVNPADLDPMAPPRLLAERFRHQAHRARRRSTQDDWTILVRALNLHLEGLRAARLQLGEVWPRVAESEKDFNRRRNALSAARKARNDRPNSESKRSVVA